MSNGRPALRQEVELLKRQRILEEARTLFYELGYRNTTMEALAEAVGMGKPFVYRHFRNKLDLLVELYDQAIALSEDALSSALAENGPPRETIRAFVRRYLDVVVKGREIVAIYFREASNVPANKLRQIDEHKRAFDDSLTAVIQEGIDAGAFAVGSARVAAYAIVGMVNWCYQWYRPTGAFGPEELGDIFSNFALRILSGDDLPLANPATHSEELP